MSNQASTHFPENRLSQQSPAHRSIPAKLLVAIQAAILVFVAGCQTQGTSKSSSSAAAGYSNLNDAAALSAATNMDLIVLHEGDTVSVTFPGATDLNTVATIRRDGRITLRSLGEFKAAGLTPPQMEKDLIKTFGSQLQTKEVSVSVQSSAFPVYVTGAVLRPGKISSDRPITALQAIIEAGGFDYTKANLKAVRVVRTQNGQTEHFILNLKDVLRGDKSEQFSLKPADIVYVPERFVLF